MAVVGEAYVAVHPEPGAAQKFGHEAESGILPSLRHIAEAAGAIFIGEKIFEAVREGLRGAHEQAVLMAQTSAVIKSTGSAANVTSEDVQRLGEHFQALTGKSKLQYEAAGNVLLGFTRIRNEAGKGNDIFNQATQAVADYSARTGVDAASAAQRFGRALNDPVRGLALLSRSGISLTKSQAEVIKKMAESGNVMGAQKQLLSDIETRYGGAAKAYGDTHPFDRFKFALAEIGEKIASGVVPALLKLANGFLDHVLPVITRFTDEAAPKVRAAMQYIGAVLSALVQGFQGNDVPDKFREIGRVAGQAGVIFRRDVLPIARQILPDLQHALGNVTDAVRATVGWFRQHQTVAKVLGSALLGIAGTLVVVRVAMLAWTVATKAQAAAQFLLDAAMNINPISVMVIAIGALVGALVYAYFHSERFRAIVQASFRAVAAVVRAVVSTVAALIGYMVSVFQGGGGRVGAIIRAMVGIVTGAVRAMVQIVSGILEILRGVFTGHFGLILSGVQRVIGGLLGYIASVPGGILRALGDLGGLLLSAGADLIRGLINGILSMGSALANNVKDFVVSHIPGPIRSILHIFSPSRVMYEIGRNVGAGLALGVTDSGDAVSAASRGLARRTVDGVGMGAGAGGGAIAGPRGTGGPLVAVYGAPGQDEHVIAAQAASSLAFTLRTGAVPAATGVPAWRPT